MRKWFEIALLMLSLITVLLFAPYRFMIFFITGIAFVSLMSKFSKTSVVLDLVALYSCILYLIGPYLGYTYFTESFPMASIMRYYMRVPFEDYFSYALPAIILFMIGLQWFRHKEESGYLQTILLAIKTNLVVKRGYVLIGIGFISYYLRSASPASLHYVFTIMFLFIFAGVLVLYYASNRTLWSNLIAISTVLWILYLGIRSSMFTIVFYMGILMVGIVFIGKNITILTKLAGFVLLATMTISLQFVKSNYRMLVRTGVERNMNVGNFIRLYSQTISNFGEVSDLKNIYPLYLRFNNGYNLALVMNRFPKKQRFDGGAALARSVLASFIPRLFWRNKPLAGGIFNMKYYADLKIDTYSTNVGPIGEAYGGFGKTGGAVFMLFFGLILSLAHRVFIKMCIHNPLLLIFMPLLFYEIIFCMENDTMQALNSLIKTSVLLFFSFKLFPGLLRDKRVTHSFLPLPI